MKNKWRDPVKNHPVKPETLAIKGDFEKFTADMKKLFNAPETGKPTSASPVPAS